MDVDKQLALGYSRVPYKQHVHVRPYLHAVRFDFIGRASEQLQRYGLLYLAMAVNGRRYGSDYLVIYFRIIS